MGTINGLTMSGWNKGTKFDVLAKIGVKFVISKASEGVTFRDASYKEHFEGCHEHKIGFGGYHFWRSLNANAQADLFLACIRDNKPDVIMIDVEENYRNPREELKNIRIFILAIHAETGLWPIWYSSRNFMRQFDKVNSEWLAPLPLMIAEWNYRIPNPCYPWFSYTLYQQWANQKIPGLISAAEFISCVCTWLELIAFCKTPALVEG